MQHYLLPQRASRPLTSTHIPRAARWRWLLPLLTLLLGSAGSTWAQTTLINETFEATNSFTAVNGSATNA